jgi:hypothetical protein
MSGALKLISPLPTAWHRRSSFSASRIDSGTCHSLISSPEFNPTIEYRRILRGVRYVSRVYRLR